MHREGSIPSISAIGLVAQMVEHRFEVPGEADRYRPEPHIESEPTWVGYPC